MASHGKLYPHIGKAPSEFRFDLVSGDWVLIATGRARKPEFFKKQKREPFEGSKKECPFEYIEAQEQYIFALPGGHSRDISKSPPREWRVVVIPNKYPALTPGERLHEHAEGPYQIIDGVGYHEVVITRDHKKSLAHFTAEETKEVIDVYQERFLDLMNERLINYVSIFHNHGRESGASISHPHSQIIAMPLIDPDLTRSLRGSRRWWDIHKKCVHCETLEWDREDGQRIVFENEHFTVVCPFASRVAFEVRVYPKQHLAYFERVKDEEKYALADALRLTLLKLYNGLDDPAYNFFLHTAPSDGKNYDDYHWHFEILPKTSTWAGFELGTGIEISTIEPEKAAEYLRQIATS